MRTAKWFGGPNDGEELIIDDGCQSVNVPDIPSNDWFKPDANDLEAKPISVCVVPVIHTNKGWILDYTRRKPRS